MKIVILTGAGVSAESGMGTFRDENGLWTQVNIEDVATPEAFVRNPAKVHAFYNARRANCLTAAPNAAHFALAELQRSVHEVTLVTQNIDHLHELAGSQDVIHMHGEIMRALCAACDHRWDAPAKMAVDDLCPSCAAPSTRPDIVWFGEIPYHMPQIEAALAAADLFVAIGTSGAVYPAAGFVQMADAMGADTLELNLAPSDVASDFADARYGVASEVVPAWVAEVMQ